MARFSPALPPRASRWLQLLIVLVALVASSTGGLVMIAPVGLHYALTADEVVVDASLGPLPLGTTVPRAAVERARARRVDIGQRTAGTALPDLCQGRWRHQGIGLVWQATSCGSEAVLLERRDGELPVLLTPADPEGFVAAVESGAVGEFPAAPGVERSRTWSLLAVAVFVVLVVPLGLILLSPRALRFEVADGALRVRTLWGTRSVPLAGATVRADPDAKPRIRLFGIGMPGHQVGLYRVDGRTVQIYLSDRRHAVWVEAPGERPVLVSPDDVAGFLAAAVDAGARPQSGA